MLAGVKAFEPWGSASEQLMKDSGGYGNNQKEVLKSYCEGMRIQLCKYIVEYCISLKECWFFEQGVDYSFRSCTKDGLTVVSHICCQTKHRVGERVRRQIPVCIDAIMQRMTGLVIFCSSDCNKYVCCASSTGMSRRLPFRKRTN